jgi:SRSO17 transposase
MNNAKKAPVLPALTAQILKKEGLLVDNLFANLWKQIGMKQLLSKIGFSKRSGTPVGELVYTLVLWVWLKKSSISMFSKDSLKYMATHEKDALYGLMNREDLNWRELNLEISIKAIKAMSPCCNTPKAFILDDTVPHRFGKKMPGVSSHFDHTLGHSVMGQQVLTLGYGSEEGFVPIDSELFISESKAQGLDKPFKDGRSIVGKRYHQALTKTKPEMAKSMMARAIKAGLRDVQYMIADAWFGTKTMLRSAEELSLTAILRMKKTKLKYRVNSYKNSQKIEQDIDLEELYKQSVRKQWEKIPGQQYLCKIVDVKLNMENTKSKKEQWRNVRLLFVRGNSAADNKNPSKHDWAAFICTDTRLDAAQILEIYALRWAIEVYFKEAKQHLGLLKEQSRHYGAYVASIHLTAIRFCLLVIAKQGSELSLSDMRASISSNLTDISFAGRLWKMFKIIISGALHELEEELGAAVGLVIETIEQHIEGFFVQALQLDTKTLRLEFL